MRARHADRPAPAGFTLVETLIATIILLVVLMVGAVVAGQASDIWHNVFNDSRAVHDSRQGLAAVAAELRRCSTSVVSVDASPTDYDVLTYQMPVGLGGGTVLWGADGVEDRRVRLTVEDGRLLRTVQDKDGAQQGRPQVLATGVDSLYEGEKGFSVALNDELVTIRVRTRAQAGGRTWRKAVTTSVWLRN